MVVRQLHSLVRDDGSLSQGITGTKDRKDFWLDLRFIEEKNHDNFKSWSSPWVN